MKSHYLALCLVAVTFQHISSREIREVSHINPTGNGEVAKRLSCGKTKQEEGRWIEQEITVQNSVSQQSVSITGVSEGEEDGDGLVYNVDYHGVTTHPSPSPKHPTPKH